MTPCHVLGRQWAPSPHETKRKAPSLSADSVCHPPSAPPLTGMVKGRSRLLSASVCCLMGWAELQDLFDSHVHPEGQCCIVVLNGSLSSIGGSGRRGLNGPGRRLSPHPSCAPDCSFLLGCRLPGPEAHGDDSCDPRVDLFCTRNIFGSKSPVTAVTVD